MSADKVNGHSVDPPLPPGTVTITEARPARKPSKAAPLRRFDVFERDGRKDRIWGVDAESPERADEIVADVVPHDCIVREVGASEFSDRLVLTRCGNAAKGAKVA